ncbi:MAG: EcsC family protein [Eubacterium sp.]|nr:EcsC family protein [Candidatus Colimonas fimequi]
MTLESELKKIKMEETILLVNARKKKPSFIDEKLEEYIPEDLESTLKSVFELAFRKIFSDGTKIIAATFDKDKPEEAEDMIKKSRIAGMVDTGITFVEGTGLGILGVGVPDIPVFAAMVLRNVYQIAATYGFSYDDKTEQIYILKLIKGALAKGKDAEALSDQVDEYANKIDVLGYRHNLWIDQEMEDAANALADSMLYMKFIQTIPVVGAVGGLSNASVIRKISKYADVKYHKRMILRKMAMEDTTDEE